MRKPTRARAPDAARNLAAVRDRLRTAAGIGSAVALPVLLAIKYGAAVGWAFAFVVAAVVVVAVVGVPGRGPSGADRSRNVVSGLALGPLSSGVAEHSARHCDTDPACPRHEPTAHHMREWPVYHGQEANLTVRRCPHGALHPDPDDARWGRAVKHQADCDGCCAPPS